jgi:heat-inducible transcriptional repressor
LNKAAIAMNTRLEYKKEQILKEMIQEYVQSARPVGSKLISQTSGLGLSPATIRNYFASFEELGLVSRPHHSAGRVPTDLGFRYFVDYLATSEAPDQKGIQDLRRLLAAGASSLETLTRQTPEILSRVSHQIGFLATPRLEQAVLREIHFLKLDTRKILGIFIFRDELVENQVLKSKEQLSGHDLARISAYLNKIAPGKTLVELRNFLLAELKAQGRNPNLQMRMLFELSEQMLREKARASLNIQGQSNLANNPEFKTPDKLEEVLKLLEDQQILLELIEQTLAKPGVRVAIGAENPLPQMRELTLITAGYKNRSGKTIGSIGVLGPKRMDYGKLIALVSSLSEIISEHLREQ